MTAIGEYLSSLLMADIVWAGRLRDAVGHSIQRLDVWAPQVNMDLTIFCCDDTGAGVSAGRSRMFPTVLPLWGFAEDGLICNLRWFGRAGPHCYNLNG